MAEGALTDDTETPMVCDMAMRSANASATFPLISDESRPLNVRDTCDVMMTPLGEPAEEEERTQEPDKEGPMQSASASQQNGYDGADVKVGLAVGAVGNGVGP